MSRDIYKIIGVNKKASLDEIRNQYLKLTREYHPDRFQTVEEQRKAELIFQDITEAYNVLKNPRLRENYDKDYGKSEKDLSEEEAEKLYRLGLQHVKDEKFFEAYQIFEQAVKLKDNDGRFYNEIAKVQMLNHNWIRKAEQSSLKAISLDNFNYEFKLTLGKVYLAANLRSRAVKVISEALDLNPGEEEGTVLLNEAKGAK